MVPLEVTEMAKLSLMFDAKLVKEVPIGARPVRIGRSPDNDLVVDNLAVSNDHARVYFESGRLVVEDRGSLNGTFVNDLRIERATLHDGDSIWIGKHHIKVDATGDAPLPYGSPRKQSAPLINETMVLDTKVRRTCCNKRPPWANAHNSPPDACRSRPSSFSPAKPTPRNTS